MIQMSHKTLIFLATQPVDFRKGIDGFAALCRHSLQQNPRLDARFVFISKRRTQISGAVVMPNSNYSTLNHKELDNLIARVSEARDHGLTLSLSYPIIIRCVNNLDQLTRVPEKSRYHGT